jgi:hypothetical protein
MNPAPQLNGRIGLLVSRVKYENIIDAIRGAAEAGGVGVYETVSLCFYKDQADMVKKWIKQNSRKKLEEKILCLIAEAK